LFFSATFLIIKIGLLYVARAAAGTHAPMVALNKQFGLNPGQTLPPVFVHASTKISFFVGFFGPSAAPPLWQLKNVKTGTQRMEFVQKAE
jgi:hypothetical protein